MSNGVHLKGLSPCSKCGAPRGESCRTEQEGVGLPPHHERLVTEIEQLRNQRTVLQAANTHEVLRRCEYERAAKYVLAHVPGYSGILDHLRHAVGYQPEGA